MNKQKFTTDVDFQPQQPEAAPAADAADDGEVVSSPIVFELSVCYDLDSSEVRVSELVDIILGIFCDEKIVIVHGSLAKLSYV